MKKTKFIPLLAVPFLLGACGGNNGGAKGDQPKFEAYTKEVEESVFQEKAQAAQKALYASITDKDHMKSFSLYESTGTEENSDFTSNKPSTTLKGEGNNYKVATSEYNVINNVLHTTSIMSSMSKAGDGSADQNSFIKDDSTLTDEKISEEENKYYRFDNISKRYQTDKYTSSVFGAKYNAWETLTYYIPAIFTNACGKAYINSHTKYYIDDSDKLFTVVASVEDSSSDPSKSIKVSRANKVQFRFSSTGVILNAEFKQENSQSATKDEATVSRIAKSSQYNVTRFEFKEVTLTAPDKANYACLDELNNN